MDNISWADRVRNEVLLHADKDRNILRTVKKREANWIGYSLHMNSSKTRY
jgi:hypothetical protein